MLVVLWFVGFGLELGFVGLAQYNTQVEERGGGGPWGVAKLSVFSEVLLGGWKK